MSGAEVVLGDCLDVMRTLAPGSVDAIVTDPPYSSGGQFRGDRMNDTTSKYVQTGTIEARPDFAGDNRDQRAYGYWCALWLSECLRIAKPGSPIVLFSDWRQLPTTTDTLQAGGWVWRGIAIWDKTEGARPAYGRFRAQAEYLVWGSAGAMRSTGDVIPGVFRYPVLQADKHHITGKPTALMRAVLAITPPGGLVLDPFAGSGTTGVACVLEGRSFLGIEREATYVEIARRRIAEAQAQTTLALESR